MIKKIIVSTMIFATALTANAGTYTGTMEYSAGSGSSSATVVIDFDLDNYFMFTYNWDGDATGWNALSALDSAGDLDIDYTDYGWGILVSDFDYPNGSEYDYGAVFTGWSYYIGDNDNWSQSGSGVSDRALSDGCWDSWVWTNYDESWNPVREPGGEPVPEPATIALLGFGGLLLRKRIKSIY